MDYSPLCLAYIGDGVYELYVRERIIKENPALSANKLHSIAIKFVSAPAQSKSVDEIIKVLNEEEIRQFKRGRNAKSYTSAKNATIIEYRRATGFEALIGYLYIKGDRERLQEIMNIAFDSQKSDI